MILIKDRHNILYLLTFLIAHGKYDTYKGSTPTRTLFLGVDFQ